MKVKELIKIGEKTMKMLHERGISMDYISSFYGVHPKSETAAYLQGEIARNMFPAIAMAVCPRCHK